MIKYIFFLLAYGLLVAVGGILVLQHPGFAHFTYGDLSIEIKLIDFFLWLAIGLPILYLIIRLLAGLINLPSQVAQVAKHKKQESAFHAMEKALANEIKLDTDKALSAVRKNIQSSPAPVLQHALAAEITRRANKYQLHEEHVAKLRALKWEAADALEAEQLAHDQKYDNVIQLVAKKGKISPRERIALISAYTALDRLPELESQLTELSKVEPQTQEISLAIDSAIGVLIQRYTEEANAKQLEKLWSTHNKRIQADPQLLLTYVRALRRNHLDTKAEQIIYTSLSTDWCDILVREYGLLNLDNINQRIEHVESWLPNHKESAGLYLTLGRLCKQAKLWGKAKDYLHSSLSRRPLSETYAELADVHEQLNEKEDAFRCAKKGIHLAVQHEK